METQAIKNFILHKKHANRPFCILHAIASRAQLLYPSSVHLHFLQYGFPDLTHCA